MAPLEVAPSIPGFHRGELAEKDRDEEVPRTASWLEEPGVDALRFVLHEVEHVLDQPSGVNTSPWSATRWRDLICPPAEVVSTLATSFSIRELIPALSTSYPMTWRS